ncbi:deoxynucleoside kinase [Paludibaculum fermentans]|uniref:deoxynucleoside kinase n=1 Tax=Paludibaculum fermentans TaxID=1473598 RepID=UPI003EBB398C
MLISIDGCVGSGKTTVAKGLASFRGSSVLLESFELNPFLRMFYEDPSSTAIETEFSFLLLHFHQLKTIAATVPTSEVIADFHLGKDLLYADLNLRDQSARQVFQELYELCSPAVPKPDILIFLTAPTSLILQRIRARQRDFEQEIEPEYYAAVNAAYELNFREYRGKKLQLPMEEWDFAKDSSLYNALDRLIRMEMSQR